MRGVLSGPVKAGLIGVTTAGAVAGMAGAAFAALVRQGRVATSAIERYALDAAREQGLLPVGDLPPGYAPSDLPVPFADGVYLPGAAEPLSEPVAAPVPEPVPVADAPDALTFAMLGDSTSVGYGCRTAAELPGVLLARGIADATGRPVRLISHGKVGSGADDLAGQVARTLADGVDVAVIVTGANDIRDKVSPWHSADRLGDAVAALRAEGVPVVAGSCPDFGVIVPIPQPLRSVLHGWSHRLAALQERATVASGGRAVSMSRLVSPHFNGHPEFFSPDRFHPSGTGYAKAVEALLPVVLEALESDGPVAGGAVDGTARLPETA
ncbi:SGNH/GDSL hydrolase family protein [Nakamurella sp. YIM 132087]|uniref:SGNH/GDSL hydrolase family protein n=1 Tax=Nakamurella alba TaxID=2665158 RepID=A0A7K1FHS3_9ACTN|nr:SGNH/GDSL hydrolase family protein [Nakamurella alba]MTD12833.1 SGNH/GDSL hydrolase family protein [Nakamurella alba]